jgi:hypothetical protein
MKRCMNCLYCTTCKNFGKGEGDGWLCGDFDSIPYTNYVDECPTGIKYKY